MKQVKRNIFALVLITLFITNGIPAKELSHLNKIVSFKTSGIRSATVVDPLGVKKRFLEQQANVSSRTDTIKIVALRVQFVADNVATTTGDGHFDLSTESDYSIDRPPHNKTYFQHQLLALSNYFRKVSNNKLILQAEVFPQGENDAYQLQNDMVYYSGQENEELKKQRWSELLKDAVAVAQDNNGPDFSAYDVVIVFHAGVGADFSFDFDATPYDIQSVFIDFETLKETLGAGDDTFEGIKTASGAIIKEGLILPETQNQEGIDLALLGTMTLLMGSQLGMPSLYDTDTGRPGIGRWGLMDQGSYNFQGLVPAQPCAWTKIYMGWEEPVVVTSAESLKVGIASSTTSPRIYKIPISSKEYFLIENRQRDWNGDGIATARDESGKRVEFDSTGQVLGEEGFGVITRLQEYDFGLPGSGILIWHIDERVIEAKLASNTINNDRDHRGVDLVECDGAQDIGYYYDMFDPGYGAENGDYFDPYWAGNVSHKYVNESDQVELSPTTIPNSNSYYRGDTHIRVFDFSMRDTVMTFSVTSNLAQKGFPQYAGSGFTSGSLLALDLSAEETVIVAVAAGGAILGWKSDGSKLVENDETFSVKTVNGREISYPYALMATADDSVLLPPAGADLDGDGWPELVVVDKSGVLYLFSLQDNNADARADRLGTASLAGTPSAGPMIAFPDAATNVLSVVLGDIQGSIYIYTWSSGWQLTANKNLKSGAITGLAALPSSTADFIATAANGDVFRLKQNGDIVWQGKAGNGAHLYQPLVADFDGKPGPEIAVFADNGNLAAFAEDGSPMPVSLSEEKAERTSAPIVADADDDGLPEVLFTSESHLWSLEISGVNTIDFPASLSPISSEALVGLTAPLWHSIADGATNVLFSQVPAGLLQTFNVDQGQPFYRLPAGAELSATPVLKDLDQDGDVELLAISGDGFLYVWDLNYNASSTPAWPQYGGNQYRNFSLPSTNKLRTQDSQLMPKKKVFCYPNPTTGNRTYIRYTLSRAADNVSIRIYDLAGDFVQELNATGMGAGDHDVIWDLTQIQSGVYLARVEAVSGSDRNLEIIKIAVIK